MIVPMILTISIFFVHKLIQNGRKERDQVLSSISDLRTELSVVHKKLDAVLSALSATKQSDDNEGNR